MEGKKVFNSLSLLFLFEKYLLATSRAEKRKKKDGFIRESEEGERWEG
jgi:hypothetical protein